MQVLCVALEPPQPAPAPWSFSRAASLDEAAKRLREQRFDALLIAADEPSALLGWSALGQAVMDCAALVVGPRIDLADALGLIDHGVQDVLASTDAAALVRAVAFGVERKRLEKAAFKAYATDLATGLPNHAQLLEHMNHLVALRAREPGPMALIALRVEGLEAVAAAIGTEAANVLRRKVAVRLRSGLRASDVVASLGNDMFAVLLAWIESPEDGARVAAKLANSLAQPFLVAGRDWTVRVSAGLASFPGQADDAEALMRRAVGQAASVAPLGKAGAAHAADRGPQAAANDPP
jgi:diguanylate cyclase (GGDEF)-like protein